jgi:hypothetical protein
LDERKDPINRMSSIRKTIRPWPSHQEFPSGYKESWQKFNPTKCQSAATRILERNHEIIIFVWKIMEFESATRPFRPRRILDGLMLSMRRLIYEASK